MCRRTFTYATNTFPCTSTLSVIGTLFTIFFRCKKKQNKTCYIDILYALSITSSQPRRIIITVISRLWICIFNKMAQYHVLGTPNLFVFQMTSIFFQKHVDDDKIRWVSIIQCFFNFFYFIILFPMVLSDCIITIFLVFLI